MTPLDGVVNPRRCLGIASGFLLARDAMDTALRAQSGRSPLYERQYDYASKSYRSVPKGRSVTRYEMKNECKSEPVTRWVTRYEYQYESHYVPPEWKYLSEQYTTWHLVESEPICEALTPEEVAAAPLGSVRGFIHFPPKGR